MAIRGWGFAHMRLSPANPPTAGISGGEHP